MASGRDDSKVLLVGFDSAWTPGKRGSLVGAVMGLNGAIQELEAPAPANFAEGTKTIQRWQRDHAPSRTLILLDQPIVIPNSRGQRPVEHLVASPVGRRYGGVQPANTSRMDMFGVDAPLWPFLATFGGAADPLQPLTSTHVLETYPILTMIALGWTLPDQRATGRLPKYNPGRKASFQLDDWSHVCRAAANLASAQGFPELASWLTAAAHEKNPTKAQQDGVDGCICLFAAAHLASGKDGVLVGDVQTGYIVSPYGESLHEELTVRCSATGRDPRTLVRQFRLRFS
jgi:predicted RNase H-like nuclease